MNIIGSKVILTHLMDNVVLYTDTPCPVSSQNPLALLFYAPYDRGVEYVRNNFGIESEVINSRF